MLQLSNPTKEMSEQILQKVPFEDRFIAGVMHMRAGPQRFSLYSLEEVFVLLNETNPQLDLNRLESWIGGVIKDAELAREIKSIASLNDHERNKNLRARDLIGMRLIQCRRAL